MSSSRQATAQVWVTATVLAVLAEQSLARVGATFSAAELADWLGTRLTSEQRTHGTSLLCKHGMLTHEVAYTVWHGRFNRYTVTEAGAAAIVEASAGKVRKSGPKGHRKPSAHKPGSLVMRLWTLLRVRGMVDSDSAASTLCDAGDDGIKQAQRTVAKYLNRWARAGALDVSARRVGASGSSNGCKRYVLREAWRHSAAPPAWSQMAKAAKASKGGAA